MPLPLRPSAAARQRFQPNRRARARFGFDGGAGFGLTIDAGGEPVGALAFERPIDRH
jgi:hypothetical protein